MACSADLPYYRHLGKLRKWLHAFTEKNTDERWENTLVLERSREPADQRKKSIPEASSPLGRTQ